MTKIIKNGEPLTVEEWMNLPRICGSKYLSYYISYVNIKVLDRRLSPCRHMSNTICGFAKSGVDQLSECGLFGKW